MKKALERALRNQTLAPPLTVLTSLGDGTREAIPLDQEASAVLPPWIERPGLLAKVTCELGEVSWFAGE